MTLPGSPSCRKLYAVSFGIFLTCSLTILTISLDFSNWISWFVFSPLALLPLVEALALAMYTFCWKGSLLISFFQRLTKLHLPNFSWSPSNRHVHSLFGGPCPAECEHESHMLMPKQYMLCCRCESCRRTRLRNLWSDAHYFAAWWITMNALAGATMPMNEDVHEETSQGCRDTTCSQISHYIHLPQNMQGTSMPDCCLWLL